jgi:hypothetical protein
MIRFTATARFFPLVLAATMACAACELRVEAQAVEGSFERTLAVTGSVELAVRSGSGSIHVSPGAGNAVTVKARLRSSHAWFSSDARERIRQIEKNPPIEQTGNSIRLGWFADSAVARNISISYDITVPAQTSVNARTGSGAIEAGDLKGTVAADTGSGSIELGQIGGAVDAHTGSGSIRVAGAASLNARSGSGSIRADGIAGPAAARTGSGGVHVAQVGAGAVEISSGSGSVSATGVNGEARVSSSSGSVEIQGRPTGAWDIHSSSGGVTVQIPPDASFDLDARVSSGRLESAHPVTVTLTGPVDRHRLTGKVRGGGPLVAIRSSSGGVEIR